MDGVNVKRKYVFCLLAILIIPGLFTQSLAFVEWNIHKTLKLDTQPLDVHQNGKDSNLFA